MHFGDDNTGNLSPEEDPPSPMPRLAGEPKTRWSLIALAGLLALAIFIFDLTQPLGVAGGVPYVTLVLLGRWFPNRSWIFRLAAVSSLLTVMGFLLSPEGGIPWMVITNRSLALIAIWTTALLASFSTHVEDALRKSQGELRSLYKTAEERAARLEITGKIAKAASSSLEPKKLFETIAGEIRRVVRCDRIIIATHDTEKMIAHHFHEEGDAPIGPPRQKHFARGLMAHELIKTKQPLVIPDLLKNSRWRDNRHAEAGYRSVVAVPVLQEDRYVAHILLASKETHAFNQTHVDLLVSVASHLGPVIQNVHLFHESRERAAQLEIIDEISKAVGSTLEPDDLFRTIVREILRVVPCNRCIIASRPSMDSVFQIWHAESLDIEADPTRMGGNEEFADWIYREVYETGRPKNIPDIRELQFSFFSSREESGIRSYLFVPILQEGRCVAHLSLSDTRIGYFTSRVEELLIQIASHLGPAIRNATLFEESREFTALLRLLAELSHELSVQTDPSSIFELIGHAGREALKADRCVIFKMDSGNIQKCVWRFGISDRFIEAVEARTGPRAAHTAVRELRPVFIHDVLSDKRTAPMHDMMQKEGYKSVLHLPLRGSGQGFGTVSYYYDEKVDLSERLIETAQTFADQAAAAIEKNKLYRQSERRADRLEILNQVTQKISGNLSLDEVLSSISDAAANLLQADHVRIYLLDAASQEFVHRASSGIPAPVQWHRIRAGEGIFGILMQKVESVIIKNLSDSNLPTHSDWVREKGLRSYLGHPLVQNGKVVGAISCLSRQENIYSEEDIKLLDALASQAIVAIINAGLFEESEDKGKRLATLVDIAQELSRDLELSNVLRTVSGAAATLMDAEAGFRLLQGNQLVRMGATPGAHDRMKRERVQIGDPIAGIVAQTAEPFITDHGKEDSRINPEAREIEDFSGAGATLCVPLLIETRVLGTLSIFRERGYVFSKEDINLATSLANLTAIAIENASLHTEAMRSRDFFRSVVDDNADAIYVTDKERNIIMWNRGAEMLYGYDAKEAIGKSVGDLIVPLDRKEAWFAIREHEMESIFQKGKSSIIESTHRMKDGTIIPVDVTRSPVRNENDDVIAICSVAKNLSERKQAEELIIQAMKEAEAASRAKSEFLSTVSHELRSPLNAVIGFSDLILQDKGVKDEMTLRLVPKIQESGKQLLSMIEEILDLDRIEQGKVTLNRESISINNLIAGLVDSWQTRIPDGYSMICDLDPDCGTVSCDPTRISQVLNNLIDNAIKYSPGGTPLQISSLAVPGEIQISVQDEGLGMSPEEIENVFERFHQLESGQSHQAGGLGIGLSLARKLMKMHGGRIWVDSQKGNGSTFTFTLPRHQAVETGTIQEDGGANEPPGRGDPWTGRTILIVDDTDHYHEYLTILMKTAGQLIYAFNGLEAIEAARKENPDLILMDLRMPVLDGFEAIERLKFDPATMDIPIIAVTAQAMEEDRARSARAGADGFVPKPIDMEEFKEELGRILGVEV